MTFECIHCRSVFRTILETVLHIWTVHLHHSCALTPAASCLLLDSMVPMSKDTEWTFWPDMVVEPADCQFR